MTGEQAQTFAASHWALAVDYEDPKRGPLVDVQDLIDVALVEWVQRWDRRRGAA